MLWVSANPGCGKSVLAKYLADSILTPGVSRAVGYFFFKDDFKDQKSITNALCYILHQIFNCNRDLLTKDIIEQFEMSDGLTSSFDKLWAVLISVAEKNAREIICLLDAFDECEDQGWSQLTKSLYTLYTDSARYNFNLKFLITSHLYGRIQRGFQPIEIQGQPSIHLSGESDAEMEKISQEINLFIKIRVDAVGAQLRLPEDDRVRLLERLTRVPNRTYLWVYLTLDLIEKDVDIDQSGIDKATSNLPHTVDEAYEQILSRSKDGHEARKLLHIIVGAVRPLTLKEMSFALALKEDHHSYTELNLRFFNDRFREYIRDLCGLFVTVVEDRIYLLHQSAREFLIQQEALENKFFFLKTSRELLPWDVPTISTRSTLTFEWRHSLQQQQSHDIIAKICIQHLLFSDFKDSHSAESVSQLTTKYGFLDYSAKHWVRHYFASGAKAGNIIRSLLVLCDGSTPRCQTWFRIYWHSMLTDLPTGFTSLIVASFFGLLSVAQYWVKVDTLDLNAKDDVYGRSALSWAAGNGHSLVVKLLVKRSFRQSLRRRTQVDSVDRHNRTPLSWAILNGHKEAARLLLKAGASINTTDNIGGTPLTYAICSEHEGIINLLMKQETHFQSRDSIKQELLLSAVKGGHDPVVKMLLERNTDIESQDTQYSRTLLSWAAGNGHIAVVKLLLENGADPDSISGQDGRTPLSWAAENGHIPVVKLLLENGADPDSKSSQDSRTPLSWAAENGHIPVVKLLLENGADPGSKSSQDGRTPLSWAADNGHPAVLGVLFQRICLESNVHLHKIEDIISVIVILHTPISLTALACILNISQDDVIDQLRLLDFLRPILDMPKDSNALIQFLHVHFQWFLLNTITPIHVEKSELHKRIASQYLHIMNRSLKQNICSLPHYATKRKEINSQTINQCLPEHLQYSCCYWAYHLEQSNSPTNNDVGNFLKQHFLYWLEIMSIMGKVYDTMNILNTLHASRRETGQELSEFLHDAQHFILRNMPIAGSAPLQVYYSRITFAPGQSTIRKTYQDEPFRILNSLPITKESWNAHLQTLQGHSDWILSVVFSPDGQMVASGSRDCTVQL